MEVKDQKLNISLHNLKNNWMQTNIWITFKYISLTEKFNSKPVSYEQRNNPIMHNPLCQY